MVGNNSKVWFLVQFGKSLHCKLLKHVQITILKNSYEHVFPKLLLKLYYYLYLPMSYSMILFQAETIAHNIAQKVANLPALVTCTAECRHEWNEAQNQQKVEYCEAVLI